MKHISSRFDSLAIGISFLCALHCLILPILLVILPSLSIGFLADEEFHFWLLFIIVPTSLAALILGCRKHRRWSIMATGLAGLGIICLSAVLGHDLIGETGEKVTTLVGSILIAFSHLKNYKICNTTHCDPVITIE